MALTTQRARVQPMEATMRPRTGTVSGALAVVATILLILSGFLEFSGPHHVAAVLAVSGALTATVGGMLAMVGTIHMHRKK